VTVSAIQLSVAARVVAWQRRRGRHDLPWQRSCNPYPVWVSEIMLQQTQVAAVIPYYERFMLRFPDVEALAAAPAEDVMAAWAGLGYYSRARNLHRCARVIVDRHASRFPKTVDELAALPGIGRSTAAAIAAFAFGERAAILDGNVKRVFARHYAVDGYPGATVVERRLWALAEAALPDDGIESYTQGLMDLGATVCVRSRPRCSDCPLAGSCAALAQDRVGELPAPRPSRARPLRHAALAIISDRDAGLLVELRPPSGIWGGLLSLPEFDADAKDRDLAAAIAARYALTVIIEDHLPELRHEFSHFSLVMHPRRARVEGVVGPSGDGARWLSTSALADAPLPAPIRRLLRQLDLVGS
jgi:A/G-specific adenine glycosylase